MPASTKINKVIYRVDVTRRIIAAAARQNAHKCAIADALKEADPDLAWVNVDYSFIQFGRHSDGLRYKYRTPYEARVFISDFDNERAPKPFQLEITNDDFVSSHRRQMAQSQTKQETDQRRQVAKATGRKFADVSMRDVKQYERETGESTVFPDGPGSAGIAKTGPKVTRSRTSTTGKARPYARRPTLKEILVAAGEI